MKEKVEWGEGEIVEMEAGGNPFHIDMRNANAQKGNRGGETEPLKSTAELLQEMSQGDVVDFAMDSDKE